MKKIICMMLCLACLLSASAFAIETTEPVVLSFTAEQSGEQIFVTAAVKNVVFNALQFCVAYDSTRLTPTKIADNTQANSLGDMARWEQKTYSPIFAPDGWMSYMGSLDGDKGVLECMISVDPSAYGNGTVGENGYIVAGDEEISLVTLSFKIQPGTTLYADSIRLGSAEFSKTGVVIATDELDEVGMVVGITDGQRVKFDLTKVAEKEKTPGGWGEATLPPAKEDDVNQGNGSHSTDNKGEVSRGGPTDIAGNWAESYINTLVGQGIVTGYSDGTFRPGNNLTRAEFAIIMTRAFRLETGAADSLFRDCSGYVVPYVNAVKNAGYMTGVDTKGNFAPNREITREEVVTVIARAMKLTAGNGVTFPDQKDISPWAVEGVSAVVEAGIVKGRPEGFAPKANITRGEAAKIIALCLA